MYCAFGYPLIGPGEDGDTTDDLFFSARPMIDGDIVGPGPGVCPDDEGYRDEPAQYEENEEYG